MKNVLLLLADGFETLEASVFIDVIGWNLVEGDCSTEIGVHVFCKTKVFVALNQGHRFF